MIKSVWLYAFAAVVVVGGGYYYYTRYHSETTVNNLSQPTAVPAPAAIGQGSSQDDLTRKTLEGIGSVKNLKPVQIPPAADNSKR
jgi:hypothetical protein